MEGEGKRRERGNKRGKGRRRIERDEGGVKIGQKMRKEKEQL